MSFTSTWREDETKGLRSLGGLLVAGLLALLLLVSGAIFLWPQDPDLGRQDVIHAGSIEDLELREPTLFHEKDLEVVWLVRLSETEVIALIARDTSRGCTVPWRPTTSFNGQEGWFRDPCSGSVYDLEGNCFFGPCPRGLDRYEVQMRGKQIQLVVSGAEVIRGKPGKIAEPIRP